MLRSQRELVVDPTYLEFFGLRRPPFAAITEPGELFHTEQYSLLAEHLGSAGRHADTLVVVRGPDGSGKTTLLQRYASSIDHDIHLVAIDESCQGGQQFYAQCLAQIGFTDITGTADELRNITREFILSRGNAGDHVLIAIDNAHLVDPGILEQLRIVADLRIGGRRVISVILAGSPGIVRAIDASALSRSSFQRHVLFNIRNYSETETANYIAHRLRLAGAADAVKLPTDAYPLIQRYSGGIPRLINKLCDYLLTEACEGGSRVITEKFVRSVADKYELLPHVLALHGKGRRSTDPDFEQASGERRSDEAIFLGDSEDAPSITEAAPPAAADDRGTLLQDVSRLSEQVDHLRADNMRALREIQARDRHIGELRNELNTKTSQIEILSHTLKSKADDFSQRNQVLVTRIDSLERSEKAAKELTGSLEREARLRATAEDSLAKATARIEELVRQNEELQASVDALRAEVEAAGERAVEIEALEKRSSEREAEIEVMQGDVDALQAELASRDRILAHLELRLQESQSACELAQRRILELKSPREIEEIERNSDRLAAELAQEKGLRDTVEDELERVTTRADELDRRNQELFSTVEALQTELEAAEKRAAAIESLDRRSADLAEEMGGQSAELDALRAEVASRDHALADLEKELEERNRELDARRDELVSRDRAFGDLEDMFEEQKRELAAREEELASRDGVFADLEREFDEQRRELDARREELASRDRALADLEKELEERNRELDARRDELVSRDRALADLEMKLEGQDRELGDSREELVSRDRALGDLESMLEEQKRELGVRQEELTSRDRVLAEFERELDEHKRELDARCEELASRDRALADLEKELEASRQERDAAQERIRDLRNPLEVEELESTLKRLAADLDRETRLRSAAENSLAKATAKIDELGRQIEEWREAVRKLGFDAGLTKEQQLKPEILGKNVSALQDEIDRKTRELDARNREFADFEKQVGPLLNRRELQTPRTKAVTGGDKVARHKGGAVSSADAPASASLVVARFEQSIGDVPAYSFLKANDPVEYGRLIGTYKRFIGLDYSDKQVTDILRAEQAKLIEKLLPRSSNKALLTYARVIVEQLDEFLVDGTDPCLTLLLPPTRRGTDALPVFSEATKSRELELLDMTLRSHDPNREPPGDEAVLPDVQPILVDLVHTYGERRVAAIGSAHDANVDTELMCEICRSLYSRLLELPKRKSANALRWVLSS